MIETLSDWLGLAQGWLFETAIQPLVFQLGFGEHVEDAFEGTEWLLIGMLELALLFLVLRPLESLIPAQQITDRRARWNDFLYTVLHRIGIFSLLIFFTLDPLMDAIAGWLRFESFQPLNLESLWPGIGPLAAFAVYFVVLDFCDYWYHRASHKFNWWWALHGLHHSQQNMNLWSDDRNHVLDDLLRDVYMGVIALCIGVEPAQYVLLVSVSRILQSLQHANVRIHFGWLGERLLVSPRYHRMHHAIGVGHENGDGKLGGCNFAVLLPVWDIIFRTANFTPRFVATGIRDQLPRSDAHGRAAPGREYGEGFWSQQLLGLKRMVEFARKDVV
ncbi:MULTISPECIES: sterol desaturase family protein [unclassified Duganella]|jgi:sterol desaturase/sphingolipid hydroxylase (fatty acid hydroxylase superfamily)|uniref:sterol desaturase family protein n=1 Tax=unclassified Duganella TaxID=2636909 RepID=UPI00087F8547|nr:MULTISPECIES: sterol desaturase family protein [unclassified Duganella]SDH03348.1 Sterol desaturase/sphingolipid hydroxylase, fatty acid hydroxylase superfamily [Duganella sp. OV458]SDK22731.1 Sterol desaturase/sphingolipid hydroxylase, fatty acid hydroxylase superfamily [Duganella sp. OV510]